MSEDRQNDKVGASVLERYLPSREDVERGVWLSAVYVESTGLVDEDAIWVAAADLVAQIGVGSDSIGALYLEGRLVAIATVRPLGRYFLNTVLAPESITVTGVEALTTALEELLADLVRRG